MSSKSTISVKKILLPLLLLSLIVVDNAFQHPITTSRTWIKTKSANTGKVPYHNEFHYSITTTSIGRRLEPSQLNAVINPSLVSSVASQAGSVSVLAFVVLIHECGHYLAARTFGMKVEEFSVGVGPKVLGFEAFGNEFNLRAVPFGGYVRFPDNYNRTEAFEIEDRITYMNSKSESKLKRTIRNILTLGFYEEQLNYVEKKIQKEEEKKKTKRKGSNNNFWNQIFTNNNKKSKEEKNEEIGTEFLEIKYYEDPDLLQNRPWPQRAVVIAGGVVFNILLTFSIFFSQIGSSQGMKMPNFESGARVTVMPAKDTAVSGILDKDDVILSFNGIPLAPKSDKSMSGPSISEAQKGISNFISTIRETPPGESLRLSVLKAGTDGKIIDDISIKPKPNADGIPSIGAMLSPNYKGLKTIRGDSPKNTAELAAQYVIEAVTDTAKGLTSAFQNVLFAPVSKKGGGGGGGAQLSGPIGLIRSGSEIVATSEIATILTFAAVISVNLAVMNSLPLPALDGGQMVFIVAEAIIGRKVDQRLQETITSAALLLLFALGISTTVGDIQMIFK